MIGARILLFFYRRNPSTWGSFEVTAIVTQSQLSIADIAFVAWLETDLKSRSQIMLEPLCRDVFHGKAIRLKMSLTGIC